MALMTCPDCANQYSDDAPYCPNCGRPNPARQAGTAGAGTGGASETPAGSAGGTPPAGTGSTGSTGSAGGNTFGAGAGNTFGGGTAGSTGGGSTGSTGGATGGGYTGATGSTSSTYTAGASETPAGGYGGTGGTGGTGGYGGGGYGGGGAGGYGGTPVGGSPPAQIPNYLVHAILVTLCCCLPFGIVSIIYATQVNSKRDVGDIAGAMEASNNAKKWAMIGAGVGVVWLIIVIAFNGLAFLAALAGGGAQ